MGNIIMKIENKKRGSTSTKIVKVYEPVNIINQGYEVIETKRQTRSDKQKAV